MKDTVIRAYEEYVLSGKNLKAGLKNLREGSKPYKYLECIDLLTKKGVKLSKEEHEKISEYIDSEESFNEIGYRYQLIKYDAAKTPEERVAALEGILKLSPKMFDDLKPADLGRTEKEKKAIKEDSKPLMESLDIDKELEKIFKKERRVGEFSAYALSKCNLKKLNKEQFAQLLNSAKKDIVLLDCDIFYDVYANWLNQEYKETKRIYIEDSILSSLTVEMLEKLMKKVPVLLEMKQVVIEHLRKKNWKEFESQTEIPLPQKKKKLLELLEYAKTLPKQNTALRSLLLLMLLGVNAEMENFEEDIFLQYLAKPSGGIGFKKKTYDTSSFCKILPDSYNTANVDIIINKHLEHFFKNGKKIETYKAYYSKKLLQEIWNYVQITTGKGIKLTKTNAETLEFIKNKVSIEMSGNNHSKFRPDEEISLSLQLKNVPILYIKVFRINTENYYRKYFSEIDPYINLDGLITAIEKKIENSHPSEIVFKQEVKFPELKNQKGIFVIEFIGNGKSSRAIIELGNLSLVSVPTIAGQLCYILDEDRKICRSESTGIFVDNTFYKADLLKEGRILVPYVPSLSQSKAILIHEELSQFQMFTRLSEIYQLKCGFVLPPESVIEGNQANLAIKPQLLLNDRNADLSLLKNVTCTLFTSNYINQISSRKTYENLELSKNLEYIIPFLVPANLGSLSVEFVAEVSNISQDKKQTLKYDHTFPINIYPDRKAILQMYFNLTDKGYNILTLGKNGEPVPGVTMSIKLFTPMMTYSITEEKITDENGILNLGKLKGFVKVEANCNQYGEYFFSQWEIPKFSYVQYPENIEIIDNEQIELPYAPQDIYSPPLTLVSIFEGQILYCWTQQIKLNKKAGELYQSLTISDLPAGSYLLSGLSDKKISITVFPGSKTKEKSSYWNHNENFIITPLALIEKQNKVKPISIKSIKEEKKGNKAQITINVEGGSKDQWRLHAFLFRYLPNSLQLLTNAAMNQATRRANEHEFRTWTNFYLSNKELSSEFRYCFERKNLAQYIGNTLEKPKLLLKREYDNLTHTEVEKKTDEVKYQFFNRKQCCKYNRKFDEKNIAHKKKKCKKSKPSPTQSYSVHNNTINAYQNFIGDAPVTVFNLPANPSGSLTIELDADYENKYGFLYIVAVDENSVSHFVNPLSCSKIQNKDMRLQTCLDSKQSFCEMRTATCVYKNDSHIIQDIASTDTQIIDSLEKVLMVMKELMAKNNCQIKPLNRFEQIIKWEKLTEEAKHKILSGIGSHELHLFIYKKDPDYFARIVKPYLRNKMEKTFIDYYLLGEKERALVYANSPSQVDMLNYLERILLIELLTQSGQKDLAQTYAQRLRDLALTKKKLATSYNLIFDTVLSLNMLKTTKENIEEIKEEVMCKEKSNECVQISCCRMVSNSCKKSVPKKDAIMEDLNEARMAQQQALKEAGETKEFAETHYYGLSNIYEPNRVVISNFWADLAFHLITSPTTAFISEHFIDLCNNLTEIIGALTFLDLPSTSAEHGYKTIKTNSAELKAASNFVIFKKEVKVAETDIRSDIMVAQRYTQLGMSEICEDEILSNQIYTCEVIVSNISSKNLDLDVLFQIPEGAVPLSTTTYQKSRPMSLQSYSTNRTTYYFYFPTPGKFSHFPVNIAHNSIIVAKTQEKVLNVVKAKSKISETNFREILGSENHTSILNFLKVNPIERIRDFQLPDLCWLLKDKKFFSSIIDLLRSQGRFCDEIWAYALFHKDDEKALMEYLDSNLELKQEIGFFFESKLLSVNPKDHQIRHLDFYPLINPRAHNISKGTGQKLILNQEFYEAYGNFIKLLIQKPNWDLSEKMTFTYYLLLQDRVTEALKIFNQINGEKDVEKEGTLRLQYDYMTAYLDFYTGSPKFEKARKIVGKYINYPVISWKLMFQDMNQQLKEYDGVIDIHGVVDSAEGKTVKSLHSEPSLSLTLEGKKVIIDYGNISEAVARFYLIDLEALFSRTPFLMQSASDFGYVKANLEQRLKLDPSAKSSEFPIPEIFLNKNIVVEVSASGLRQVVTYYSTSLKVHINENYGELKITDNNGVQLSKIYVKVFSRNTDSTESFYKDGYTDICGIFDYVSLNASKIKKVSRFSLLILSDKYGCLIRECNPPPHTISADLEEEEVEPSRMRVQTYSQKMQKCKKK